IFFAETMSTMLEFGFVPGGGFALGDHKSFDRLRRLLPHNYHISAEENWPTLTIAITARRLSRRVISIVLAASLAHRASHKLLLLQHQLLSLSTRSSSLLPLSLSPRPPSQPTKPPLRFPCVSLKWHIPNLG
ncbi:hypothetical protein ACLOJK_036343, partial [Asimina triloba]